MNPPPAPNSTQVVQRQLRVAKRFIGEKTRKWRRDWIRRLLLHKYGTNTRTRARVAQWEQIAYQQFHLNNINPPITQLQKHLVLIKRMLDRDYRLKSRQYQQVGQNRVVQCKICQSQQIDYIYKTAFNGDNQNLNQQFITGIKCGELIQSLKEERRVVIFDHKLHRIRRQQQ